MGRPPQPCLQGVTARTAMSRLPCKILPLNAVRGTDLESRGESQAPDGRALRGGRGGHNAPGSVSFLVRQRLDPL